jgi:hypothetical protein
MENCAREEDGTNTEAIRQQIEKIKIKTEIS